jgi:radical SAM superfamily enzyme YgiQ (UPF0313 family)
MNVLMLYPKFPAETFWNTARSVELLWNRKAIMPPLGLLTLASYLPQDFSIRVVDRNVGPETDADWQWADVVFLSLMMAQRADFGSCVARAKLERKPIAVGGPFTHALPEVAAADADWVCFGEAESIMDEFVGDLRAGRRGKKYQGGSETDMERVRPPRFELLTNVNDYATMPLQFSRGCPFKCEFCDIIEIYGRVPRAKTPGQVCGELAALKRLGFRGYVFMVDDNFIGNKRKAKAMLEELALWNRAQGYPFRYYTEASINLADDDELLERMSRACFSHVFIGIETPDPKLLKTTQKMQNVPGDPLAKLAKVRARGIHVTAGFIVGFDGEDLGVFETQKNFIQASGIGIAMVGLLQAIPHTQLARRLRSEGRLLETLHLGGISTTEGLNFIPKGGMTKREYLENYRALVREVYDPEAFFARSLPALLSLRSKIPAALLWQQGRELLTVLLREFYHLGIKSKTMRRGFWKTFFQLAWKNPAALEAFVFDCGVFHHLNRHADHIQRELSAYLSQPSPDDVLDEASEREAAPPAPVIVRPETAHPLPAH